MSFPKYPQYKDSGVEWLGEVPEHWKLSKIKHIAAITGGGTPNREIVEYWNGSIPWVSPKDMKAESILGAEESITELGLQNSSSTLQSAGRVLMVIRSGILQHTIPVAINKVPVALNQDMKSFCFLEDICLSRFFLRWVQGLNDILLLEWANQGATVESVNQTLLQNTIIPIPNTSEQRLITEFLDRETTKIDELVAEQRRLIELLKEKRQAVISHAVTKGLNPNAPMKPSGIEWLGDVPEHWEVIKLGRASFMQEGPGLRNWQFTDDGTRVICVTNITEKGIDFSRLEKFISVDEYNSSYQHFTVQSGDILLSSSGNSWGKVAIYNGDEKVMLNTSTIRLNEAEGRPLIRDFLARVLQSIMVREQLGLAMTGSCQPNFGPTHLNCVMVAVPLRNEQSEIVAYLNAETAKLDTLTTEAERAIELLHERRTALISAAVTGKIDVRGFVSKESGV